MPASEKIAVVGATGRVGRHVAGLLAAAGHEVVPVSRATGADVASGQGLARALTGVACVIDAASASAGGARRLTPAQAAEWFLASARNLHETGREAGVQRMVEVSVLGVDRFTGGHGAAKHAHERAMLAGPVPVRVLRAAHFHEMIPQLIEWGTSGGVARVRRMRIQPVAARAVAEALIGLATDPAWAASPDRSTPPFPEIAGPRPEDLVELARQYATGRGGTPRIRGFSDPGDPDDGTWTDGSLLPGRHATLAGPPFGAWLAAQGA